MMIREVEAGNLNIENSRSNSDGERNFSEVQILSGSLEMDTQKRLTVL